MNRSRMNGTDLEVSSICLGGGSFGSKLTKKQSYEVLDRYVALGGNFIDTAKVYCSWIPGMERISETVIGTWLKERGNANDLVMKMYLYENTINFVKYIDDCIQSWRK